MTVLELKKCLDEMDDDLSVFSGGIHDKLSDSECVTDVVFAESVKQKEIFGVYLRTE